jgi:ABC-type lipoprotein export system ATPase subunit
MSPHIRCTDLVRIFSAEGVEVQALQGLTLAIDRGEPTANIGASGSG